MSAATPLIVLVTGANSGIGYEVVKALLLSPRPYHTFVGARNLAKAEGAITSLQTECPDSTDTLSPLPVDLNSDSSIQSAYEQVKSATGKIDVLINNAGATFDLEHIHSRITLRQSFTKAYDVNVAGTHVLTHTFAPLLLASTSGDPRLIFVAGLANQTAAAEKYFPTAEWPKGWPKEKKPFETIGYRCSKTAMNMLMLDWNHKLKNDGVKVWAVGPGINATNLGGDLVPSSFKQSMSLPHPSAGADIILRTVEGERDGDVGRIVIKDGGVSTF